VCCRRWGGPYSNLGCRQRWFWGLPTNSHFGIGVTATKATLNRFSTVIGSMLGYRYLRRGRVSSPHSAMRRSWITVWKPEPGGELKVPGGAYTVNYGYLTQEKNHASSYHS